MTSNEKTRDFPYRHLDSIRAPMPRIVAMGTELLDDYWGRRFHVNRFPHLIHVHEGTGWLVFTRRRYRFAKGDTLVVPARTPHKDMYCPDMPHRATLIIFEGAVADRMLRNVRNPDLLNLRRADTREIHRRISAMVNEFESAREGSEWVVHCTFLELLVHIRRSVGQQPEGVQMSPAQWVRIDQIVSDVKAYVASHLGEAISLTDLARIAHVSPFYLSHIFTTEVGVPLFRYITEQRMEEAKRLLTEENMSVKQAAYQLGFRDVGYFTKLFRREVGVTPGAYGRSR